MGGGEGHPGRWAAMQVGRGVDLRGPREAKMGGGLGETGHGRGEAEG